MKNSLRFPQLMRSPFLEGLPQEDKSAFLDDCTIRMLEAGEEFLTQGEPCSTFYMVAHGVVQISYGNEQGSTVLIGYDGPGDILGDLEALSQLPCLANCTAFKPAILLEMPYHQFITFMRRPEFLRNHTRIQFRRFNRDNELKAADQLFSVDQKLCSHLLNLSQHTTSIEQSQAALAASIGCTRQTINKGLNLLKSEGVVEIRKGAIKILDRDALADRLP